MYYGLHTYSITQIIIKQQDTYLIMLMWMTLTIYKELCSRLSILAYFCTSKHGTCHMVPVSTDIITTSHACSSCLIANWTLYREEKQNEFKIHFEVLKISSDTLQNSCFIWLLFNGYTLSKLSYLIVWDNIHLRVLYITGVSMYSCLFVVVFIILTNN